MAMIPCPSCGKMISDRASKCVNCGHELPIKEEQLAKKRHCVECGEELEDDAIICPNCGCPVDVIEDNKPTPQQVEVTGVKMTNRTKKLIIGAVVAIAAIIIIGMGVHSTRVKKAEAEAERIRQEEAEAAEKRSKDYIAKVETASISMLGGAVVAEKCCSLVNKVWHDAIYEKYSTDTAQYTKPNGYYVGFNTALSNLFQDKAYSSNVETLTEDQSDVKALMKELTDPPAEHEKAYNALSELYDTYMKLTNMAISPSGSYETFSKGFSEADELFLSRYEALSLYFD